MDSKKSMYEKLKNDRIIFSLLGIWGIFICLFIFGYFFDIHLFNLEPKAGCPALFSSEDCSPYLNTKINFPYIHKNFYVPFFSLLLGSIGYFLSLYLRQEDIQDVKTESMNTNLSLEPSAKYFFTESYLDQNPAILKIIASFEDSENRIREEIFVLTKRSNLNLIIGILAAGIGIGTLFYMFEPNITVEKIPKIIHNDIMNYLFLVLFPKTSLVALIEAVAYFFLRLYNSCLLEIKYFQNELINISHKKSSLLLATQSNEQKVINDIISKLINTERNK